jgi:hypothetical protein
MLSYIGAAIALWIAVNIVFLLAIGPGLQRSRSE